MNLESKLATDEGGLIDKLAAVGIPVVFIDFRERPFENAEKSIRILGQVIGREQRAEEVIAFRRAEIEKVTARLAAYAGPRPQVMIDRAGGYSDECCMSFGDENFGRMVSVAGGDNIARDLIPGTFGTLNPEQIVASKPDVVVVTGSNWTLYETAGAWVGVGPGADRDASRARLQALMQRPAFTTIPATRDRPGARHLAPVLRQPLPVRGDPGAGEMAASGAVRRSRPGRDLPDVPRALPAGRVPARLLGLADAGVRGDGPTTIAPCHESATDRP